MCLWTYDTGMDVWYCPLYGYACTMQKSCVPTPHYLAPYSSSSVYSDQKDAFFKWRHMHTHVKRYLSSSVHTQWFSTKRIGKVSFNIKHAYCHVIFMVCYVRAFAVFWCIVAECAVLIWSIVCFVFFSGIWSASSTSTTAGGTLRSVAMSTVSWSPMVTWPGMSTPMT